MFFRRAQSAHRTLSYPRKREASAGLQSGSNVSAHYSSERLRLRWLVIT